MSKLYSVVVCASGGGGNFEAVARAQEDGGYKVIKLIVDRPCGAVQKAEAHGIPVISLNAGRDKLKLMHLLEQSIPPETDLVVLAGFMPIVSEGICRKWGGKIINTHPSLLPKYGGKGMYGVKVQEAVMAAKEEFAGCTVHYVSSEIDGGQIIAQRRVNVDYAETPWELGGRVFRQENELLVEVIRQLQSQSKNHN